MRALGHLWSRASAPPLARILARYLGASGALEAPVNRLLLKMHGLTKLLNGIAGKRTGQLLELLIGIALRIDAKL